MIEIDHVMCFVGGPVDEARGFTLDAGMRHDGQGTQNRRIAFDRNYVELIWIVDEGELAASGLSTFADRCAGRATAFGVVLRGEVEDAAAFRAYEMASGFRLQLLVASLEDPELPFVALIETAPADLARRHPAARFGPTGHDGIAHATFTAPRAPSLAVRDASFAIGAPALTLDLGDRTLALAERWR